MIYVRFDSTAGDGRSEVCGPFKRILVHEGNMFDEHDCLFAQVDGDDLDWILESDIKRDRNGMLAVAAYTLPHYNFTIYEG